MKSEKILKQHCFVFNPEDNSGEHVDITTKFFANGDTITDTEGVFMNQTLNLQSYCNSCAIELCGCSLTPKLLRQLADELEEVRKSIK